MTIKSSQDSATYLKEEKRSPMDLAQKILLIRKILNTYKKTALSATYISDQISSDYGFCLSPDECSTIIKNYSFLLKKSYKYEMTFSLLSSIIFYCIGDGTLVVNLILSILAFPVFFVIYREVVLSSMILRFDPRHLTPKISTDTNELASIAIIIASRNEPFSVAKMTFDSALRATYPCKKKQIIIVDNSDTHFKEYSCWKDYVETHRIQALNDSNGSAITFIHRDGVEGFKPRNLDIGLQAVTSEFILYLDIDSTIKQDTLLRAVPILTRDASLAFVQLHTIQTNARGSSPLAPVQSVKSFFLRFTTAINCYVSHSLFYGHNAIWRTKVVRDIGSCLEYYRGEVVVTEDLSMALRASFLGYQGATAWVESGEWVPESMRETESMWLRWTVGTYQVYAAHFTRFKNLKALNFSEFIGWCSHAGVLINSGLIPFFILLGLITQSSFLMAVVAVSFLSDLLVCAFAFAKLSLGNMHLLRRLYVCYAAFLLLTPFINWIKCIGLFRFLLGKKQGWVPTAKSGGHAISFRKILHNHSIYLLHSFTCLCISIFSVAFSPHNNINLGLTIMCGLYGFNSLLSLIIFGKSEMQGNIEEASRYGHVENFDAFYINKNNR